MKTFYVYMVCNRSRTVLYTGVTNDLEGRLWFHRNENPQSFVRRYHCDRLMYYESFSSVDAITREKEIKGWRREKKNNLVRTLNPAWRDLRQELFGRTE